MTLAYRTNASGLTIAEHAMDERSIQRMLDGVRTGFSLQKRTRDEEAGGELVYKIVHIRTGTVVLTWMDDHRRALPLSSGIVEAFQKLQLDSRNREPDADEYNRKLVEEHEKDRRRMTEALMEEHAPRIARGRTVVSLSDAKKPRYWRTRDKRPKSGHPRWV